MTFVLVHGGGFGASCWDPIMPVLPASTVAVDLPGRGTRPAPLGDLTIADFVDAVVEDIESRDLRDVVLVGHSLAGITMPGVAARIPKRLARLVFVSCTVPADGQSTVDTLDPEVQQVARENAGNADGGRMDDAMAVAMFCNDMTPEQTEWTLAHLVPEAPRVPSEPVSLAGLQEGIPCTWIRLERDLIVAPWKQNLFAERTNSEIVSLDAAHMAMVSHPAELAALLRPLATV
jgi:pimeloyl-ACP methyl ester carboxylesterase